MNKLLYKLFGYRWLLARINKLINSFDGHKHGLKKMLEINRELDKLKAIAGAEYQAIFDDIQARQNNDMGLAGNRK